MESVPLPHFNGNWVREWFREDTSLGDNPYDLLHLAHVGNRMLRILKHCVYGGTLFVSRHLPYPGPFPKVVPEHPIHELPFLDPVINPAMQLPKYWVDVARIGVPEKIVP